MRGYGDNARSKMSKLVVIVSEKDCPGVNTIGNTQPHGQLGPQRIKDEDATQQHMVGEVWTTCFVRKASEQLQKTQKTKCLEEEGSRPQKKKRGENESAVKKKAHPTFRQFSFRQRVSGIARENQELL